MKNQFFTITSVGNRLCVASAATSFSDPEVHIHHFPTGLEALSNSKLLGIRGDKVTCRGSGGYGVQFGETFRESVDLKLINGGSTKSIFSEKKDYKCPKSRGKETRYSCGTWQRLMVKGWVDLSDPMQFVASVNNGKTPVHPVMKNREKSLHAIVNNTSFYRLCDIDNLPSERLIQIYDQYVGRA